MSGWIDREKAIEDLQNGDPSQLYDLEDIKYWLNCLPSAQPEQQWIPCSERLPELYKPVLVTGGDIIWICELIESPDLDDGEFQWEDKMLGHWYSFDNWDAWCPLPEPWKGE